MNSWSSIMQAIEKNPAMYLGTYSIFNFESFWCGYCLAKYPLGTGLGKDEEEFDNFLKWIPQRCGIKSSQSWAKIIFFCSGDERDSLSRMFDFFREYKDSLSEK